jgi:hypothetical protein
MPHKRMMGQCLRNVDIPLPEPIFHFTIAQSPIKHCSLSKSFKKVVGGNLLLTTQLQPTIYQKK